MNAAQMNPDPFLWPVVFTGSTAVYFEPTTHLGSAYFGGPLEQEFDGLSFGPEPLHRIFTFSPAGMPQPKGNNLQGRMSLFFGMRYQSCQLVYDVEVAGAVNAQVINDWDRKTSVTAMRPTASNPNWPYQSYPVLLPYVRMKERERTEMAPEEFAEQHIQGGLPELTAADMCIVVPPVSAFGVSMWGPTGDDAGSQIVFRYGYRTNEIRACYSQAT